VFGIIFLIFTFPPTAATAIIKVPASILSGITEILIYSTLTIQLLGLVRVFEPIPEILAPISFNILHKLLNFRLCSSIMKRL
jgi:hypothetical protein